MAERKPGRPRPNPTPSHSAGQPVLVISTDRRVLWSNGAARVLLARDDGSLDGKLCHSLLSQRDTPCEERGGCPLPASVASGQAAACTLHPRGARPQLNAVLQPVPGPRGEVAEFVITISASRHDARPGHRSDPGTEELALLFTLSEMDKRGCDITDVVQVLARSLRRSLGHPLVAIYLPSQDARCLLLRGSAVAPPFRRHFEQALGGSLPSNVAIPDLRDSLLWRAFRAARHTVLRDPAKLEAAILEHTQSPALSEILPTLRAALDVRIARLIPIRSQGQAVGLVLVAGRDELSQKERDAAHRCVESTAEIIRRMVQRNERRRLQRRTAAILSAVQDGVLGLDTNANLRFANRSAIELLGWQRERFDGRSLIDLRAVPAPTPGGDPADAHPLLGAALGGVRIHRVETQLHHRDGRILQVAASVAPLEEDGENRGAVVTFSDIGDHKRVEDELRQSLKHLRLSLSGTVLALGRMAEMRDPYTAGHQQRVAQLARAIADRMGLAPEQVELVRLAALVHDIGKIGVPVELLTKPGTLAGHEFELMRTHTTVGWEILNQAHLHQAIADIARQHHERLDGSGYPDGLEGTRIRREARIIAVADTVEAMASHRPYRAARGIDEALTEIFRQRGRHYEPAAVDACIQLFRVANFTFTDPSP